jgi:hypothetical protein
MGPILGAEFLVAVGDLCAFENADQLAAYAGLVPAVHDSGKRVGNNKRMRGGNKILKRVFYQSAFSSLRASAESRTFYERKRAEGKRHTQAGYLTHATVPNLPYAKDADKKETGTTSTKLWHERQVKEIPSSHFIAALRVLGRVRAPACRVLLIATSVSPLPTGTESLPPPRSGFLIHSKATLG